MTDEPRTDLLDPPPAAGDAATAEAPAGAVPAGATDPMGTDGVPPGEPPAPTPGSDAGPPNRPGMFVPRWVFAILAGLLIFGMGLLGGYAIGSDEDHRDGRDRASSEQTRDRRSDAGGRFGRQTPPGFGNLRPRQIDPPSTAPGPSAFLGVAVENSTSPEGAALVQVVASSPAAEAGLKRGDVITKIDGTSITDAATLTSAVRSHAVGDTVKVAYSRDGADTTVDVTLVTRGASAPQ